jgi:hypothetical protein
MISKVRKQDLIDMDKTYPNDGDLGRKVRKFIRDIQQQDSNQQNDYNQISSSETHFHRAYKFSRTPKVYT